MKPFRALPIAILLYIACYFTCVTIEVPDPAIYSFFFVLPIVVGYVLYAVLEAGEPVAVKQEETSRTSQAMAEAA